MTPNLSRTMRRRLPAAELALLSQVGRRALELGTPAYLVGGVVRDLLLGRDNHDLDVVVEKNAAGLARKLAVELGASVRVHAPFQTATLLLGGGLRVDLASARTEHYPRPAALPVVVPGRLRDDLSRRDFTINTLALRLAPPRRFGELLDYFGGREDVRAGVIRVLHDRSFLDDPTRAFRAVRFASRLDFRIAPRTRRLIVAAREEGAFGRLSAQRLRREVELLLEDSGALRSARALDRLGLLGVLNPRLKLTPGGLERLRRARLGVLRHRSRQPDEQIRVWVVLLGALALDLAPAAHQALLRRLRPARTVLKTLERSPGRVRRLLSRLARPGAAKPSRIHTICRDETVELLLLAAATAAEPKARRPLTRYLDDLRRVRADIGGRDLLRAGVPAGQGIARGLDAALGAKLDGRAITVPQQLAVALRAAGPRARRPVG